MALLPDVGVDPILPMVRSGQPLSAREENRLRARVNELGRGAAPGRQRFRAFPGEAVGVEVAEFNVVTSNDNVLHCNPVVDGTIDATTTIYVAKPWEHRRTSLNGKTVGGISFSNWQIFSDTVQASSGGIVEIWRISQPYAGWTIAAAHVGDVLGMKFNNEPVEWLCVQSPDHAWTFRP